METFDFFLSMGEEMLFGLKINNYDRIVGSYGYYIKLDISAQQPYLVQFVAGATQPLAVEEVETSQVALSILLGYLEDENCPNLAWNFSGETLTIFFKESVYDYGDDDCRFGYKGIRRNQKVSAATDLMDVPNDKLLLAGIYALNMAWIAKKRRLDEDLEEQQKQLEYELEN